MRVWMNAVTAADGVGAASVALGGFLTVAPDRAGRWLGLTETGVRRRRTLGATDLGLGIAIFTRRRSGWRWLAVGARALLHLVFAREYVRSGRRSAGVAMGGLFVVDSAIALKLHRSPELPRQAH